MLSLIYFCALLFVSSSAVVERPCNKTELPCDRTGCIERTKWCDGVTDCEDSSDEAYCFNRKPCLLHHFRCHDGTCIPLSAKCDDYSNCKDDSDEICGTYIAVKKSVNWILNQRESDRSWGSRTPRAVVALAFADTVVKMDEEDKNLIAKRLNILLTLDLMRNKTDKLLSPSELSLYINALYATCQDPLNFQGVDLVSLLRHQTDAAINDGTFHLPIAMLTLCFAYKSYLPRDLQVLSNFYWSLKDDRIDAKAITIMAITCISSRNSHYLMTTKQIIEDFKNSWKKIVKSDMDIYTRGLYLQAMISIGFDVDSESLLKYQDENGSFKDLLATYYAMPVLMNSSLVSLTTLCRTSLFRSQFFEVSPVKSSADKKATLSIWIGSESDKNIHSMEITFSGNKTLFDIMKVAEARDETFRFMYEETGYDGKKVYSVAGVPDDAERGVFWNLFSGYGNHLTSSLNPETRGLDRIFPEHGESFTFWLNMN